LRVEKKPPPLGAAGIERRIKMEITRVMFENAYQIARRVYANEIQLSDGVQMLVADHNMRPTSANDYIYAYQKMRNGEPYTRSINAAATDYYLTQIYREEGIEGLRRAIAAANGYIEYYEERKGNLPLYRAVVERVTREYLNAV
jgi:5-methylcytosine-specific restriction protein A